MSFGILTAYQITKTGNVSRLYLLCEWRAYWQSGYRFRKGKTFYVTINFCYDTLPWLICVAYQPQSLGDTDISSIQTLHLPKLFKCPALQNIIRLQGKIVNNVFDVDIVASDSHIQRTCTGSRVANVCGCLWWIFPISKVWKQMVSWYCERQC